MQRLGVADEAETINNKASPREHGTGEYFGQGAGIFYPCQEGLVCLPRPLVGGLGFFATCFPSKCIKTLFRGFKVVVTPSLYYI